MSEKRPSPFNSPLETGIRTVAVLVASYPRAHDLSRLVQYDYLTVHSADADGPPSLHPPLPLRSGELLVRRGLIEAGLRLMMSRRLVQITAETRGLLYSAEDVAGAFFGSLRSSYIRDLCERAQWVADTFDGLSTEELDAIVKRLFEAWTTEFQPARLDGQAELPI
jgi:hypothetical protein